jgi:hypothetical protein
MIRLDKRQILLLHQKLIDVTGGVNGIRDEGMLDSALFAPFQTFLMGKIFTHLRLRKLQDLLTV